jgi:putative ABC transport system permease protein
MTKFLPLIWAGLWRKPARTIFTFASITVAFILFGLMSGIDAGFAHLLEVSRADRLFTDPRFGAPMPLAYAERIARLPGVTVVAPRQGMVGFYQEPRNGLGVIATDPDSFYAARTELSMTKDQIETLKHTRTGAAVGVATAKKYGWRVGDKIPLQTNTDTRNGGRVWIFDIVALVEDVDRPGQEGRFVVNYTYLDEERAAGKGMTDRFILRIDDPNRATQISRDIDALFANSSAPTRTQSELTQRESGVQSIGDINFFTDAVVGAVLFMLLVLTGNTMMQSVRERVPEFAVLKTLGYSDEGVLTLVLSEAVLLCVFAALAGLMIAKLIIPLLKGYFPDFPQLIEMPWAAVLTGFGTAILVACAAALIPAVSVRQLKIVDALAMR